VPVPRGPRQRRPTIDVIGVNVGGLLEQQLHRRLVPVLRQRRLTIFILGVDVDSLPEQQLPPRARSPRPTTAASDHR
jgi:hypothetical protein